MEDLTYEEIIESLKTGKISSEEVLQMFENGKPNFHSIEMSELILAFNNDEDKIKALKYIRTPIKIIRTLTTEESKLEALKYLPSDTLKLKVITKYIKRDDIKLAAIEMLDKEESKLIAKMSLTKDEFSKFFFKGDKSKVYKIGLDPRITFGIEIETEAEEYPNYSEKIRELTILAKRRTARRCYRLENYRRT